MNISTYDTLTGKFSNHSSAPWKMWSANTEFVNGSSPLAWSNSPKNVGYRPITLVKGETYLFTAYVEVQIWTHFVGGTHIRNKSCGADVSMGSRRTELVSVSA